MDRKDETSEGRIRLDDPLEEDDLEEEDEAWPRPSRDIRAHLYKWILGLAVLVALLVGADLYFFSPFGTSGRLATERIAPPHPRKQQAVPAPRPEPASPATKTEKKTEPSVTYVPIREEEPEPPAISLHEEARRISPTMLDSGSSNKAESPASQKKTQAAAPLHPEKGSTLPKAPARKAKAQVAAKKQPAPMKKEPRTAPPRAQATAKKKAAPSSPKRTARKPSHATPSRKPSPKATTKTTAVRRPAPRPTWYVQVGAFSIQKNAVQLKKQLERAGYPSHIRPTHSRSGRMLYLVRVGPYPSRTRAWTIQRKIERQGHRTELRKEME